MEWTRVGLQAEGWSGFVLFEELPEYEVPREPGVYAVLRVDPEPPAFLEASVAGWFKGRDPSVTREQLDAAWVAHSEVLYLGKAGGGASGRRGIRKRLDEYRRHDAGGRVGHWGGRYVWQLADHAQLLVAWLPTPERDPAEAETELLDDFVRSFGVRPFANLTSGRGRRDA